MIVQRHTFSTHTLFRLIQLNNTYDIGYNEEYIIINT